MVEFLSRAVAELIAAAAALFLVLTVLIGLLFIMLSLIASDILAELRETEAAKFVNELLAGILE